jgi:hypothetical protein
MADVHIPTLPPSQHLERASSFGPVDGSDIDVPELIFPRFISDPEEVASPRISNSKTDTEMASWPLDLEAFATFIWMVWARRDCPQQFQVVPEKAEVLCLARDEAGPRYFTRFLVQGFKWHWIEGTSKTWKMQFNYSFSSPGKQLPLSRFTQKMLALVAEARNDLKRREKRASRDTERKKREASLLKIQCEIAACMALRQHSTLFFLQPYDAETMEIVLNDNMQRLGNFPDLLSVQAVIFSARRSASNRLSCKRLTPKGVALHCYVATWYMRDENPGTIMETSSIEVRRGSSSSRLNQTRELKTRVSSSFISGAADAVIQSRPPPLAQFNVELVNISTPTRAAITSKNMDDNSRPSSPASLFDKEEEDEEEKKKGDDWPGSLDETTSPPSPSCKKEEEESSRDASGFVQRLLCKFACCYPPSSNKNAENEN